MRGADGVILFGRLDARIHSRDAEGPVTRMDSTGDSTRSADLRRASEEVIGRLESLGITLNGDESPEALILVLEEVERFEEAVEAAGGDLMLDENPPGTHPQPDDPRFALPIRRADETIRAYRERLARATDDLVADGEGFVNGDGFANGDGDELRG